MSDDVSPHTIGRVAVLTIEAPERRNALTIASSDVPHMAIRAAEQDEGVHALVLTGAPSAFCAGADLSALGSANEDGLRRIYRDEGQGLEPVMEPAQLRRGLLGGLTRDYRLQVRRVTPSRKGFKHQVISRFRQSVPTTVATVKTNTVAGRKGFRAR